MTLQCQSTSKLVNSVLVHAWLQTHTHASFMSTLNAHIHTQSMQNSVQNCILLLDQMNQNTLHRYLCFELSLCAPPLACIIHVFQGLVTPAEESHLFEQLSRLTYDVIDRQTNFISFFYCTAVTNYLMTNQL